MGPAGAAGAGECEDAARRAAGCRSCSASWASSAPTLRATCARCTAPARCGVRVDQRRVYLTVRGLPCIVHGPARRPDGAGGPAAAPLLRHADRSAAGGHTAWTRGPQARRWRHMAARTGAA